MQLMGKRLLVTGASGGIGTALCRLLEQHGVKLVMTCHQAAPVDDLRATLGKAHDIVPADISTQAGRDEIVSVCEHAGGIDGVINLAGIMDFSLFANQSPQMISRTLEINTLSPILLTHQLLPQLTQKDSAIILNVGSIFGSIGHPGFTVYCASKAAIKTFSEALSREMADTPVRVSYIAPRATATKLNSEKVMALNTALGNKADTPDYVARQIIDTLLSEQSQRFLGWPEKLFVRLNALFPSLVHRALVGKLKLIKQYANS